MIDKQSKVGDVVQEFRDKFDAKLAGYNIDWHIRQDIEKALHQAYKQGGVKAIEMVCTLPKSDKLEISPEGVEKELLEYYLKQWEERE